jgi:hypothetical protein
MVDQHLMMALIMVGFIILVDLISYLIESINEI